MTKCHQVRICKNIVNMFNQININPQTVIIINNNNHHQMRSTSLIKILKVMLPQKVQ